MGAVGFVDSISGFAATVACSPELTPPGRRPAGLAAPSLTGTDLVDARDGGERHRSVSSERTLRSVGRLGVCSGIRV